jgi:hypothetical protein
MLTLLALGVFPAYAADLTADYLYGEWCYESMKSGDQVEQENKNWVFERDGKFLMQQSASSNKLKQSGTWDIKDGKLQIKPAYMGGHKPVEIVSDNKFIFKWMFGADMQVVRGKCK